MSDALRVVIADDQALVRSGFTMILVADGIEVVGQAGDGEEALDRSPNEPGRGADGHPDAAARRTGGDPADPSRGGPAPRIVILTTFDLDQYVYAAMAAGASGFLLKDVSPEQLVAAVRLVRTGDALLAPVITRRLIQRYARRDRRSFPLIGDLSALTA